MKKTEQSYAGWYFLIATVIISAIVFTIKPDSFIPSMNFFLNILKKIIPIFILVFVLMVIVNLFVSPKRLIKYLGKNAGIKGWLIAMGAGIISTGPIYMWYPMLNDMQKKGMRNAFVATFLYNRAVKPALIPLMIFYFGLLYVIVLTIVMVITSVFQGLIVEKILEVRK